MGPSPPPLPLTALYNVGQVICYLCSSFLISKMGEIMVTTSKLYIVETGLACSKYSMTYVVVVLSNRKLLSIDVIFLTLICHCLFE